MDLHGRGGGKEVENEVTKETGLVDGGWGRRTYRSETLEWT